VSEPIRCWQTSDEGYARYHDEEWGRPVREERGIYERLCLEGFQSGLSWLTILRKRPAFREAFDGFDPDRVATFGETDVERLLGDAGIVRHRGKIEAAIANARAAVVLRETGEPLNELFWSYAPRLALLRARSPTCRGRRRSRRRSRNGCAAPASASSGRPPSTPPCKHAVS
jgi:DNA-3-methyladenine glycosylase I